MLADLLKNNLMKVKIEKANLKIRIINLNQMTSLYLNFQFQYKKIPSMKIPLHSL